MGKTAITFIACAMLAASSLRADGRNPGSVLVFPAQRTNAAGFTIVSVTNVNVNPQTPISKDIEQINEHALNTPFTRERGEHSEIRGDWVH